MVARIDGLKFPFSRTNNNKEYFTKVIALKEPGLNIGPSPVSIYYEDRQEEIFLGRQESLAIDTVSPSKPENLRTKECGSGYFVLAWESGEGRDDAVEYTVQRLESGTWVKLPPGSVSTPEVRINSEPRGRIRVVAVDWALNREESDEIEIECNPLRITSLKILAPLEETPRGVSHINGRLVTDSDFLNYAYAVEVTADKESRLLLVNVDSKGYGYRLLPTPCRTGRNFDTKMLPSVPRRYPSGESEKYYIGLDDIIGKEQIYAIIYEDDKVKHRIWEMVLNEICVDGSSGGTGSTAKGSRELPGIHVTDEKKKVFNFEKKLNELLKAYKGSMNWKKTIFIHQ